MADENDTKKKKKDSKTEDSKAEKTDKKTSGGGILQWIIIAVVIVLFAGSGFVLGRLFGSSGTTETTESSQQDQPAQAKKSKADVSDSTKGDPQKTWYYDMEPVVANLDEPGAMRYVRATITLEMNSEEDEKKSIAFLDEKKPLLTNWLTIYLASLSIEDIRGDKNLRRIQSQILDAFNERLYPDTKPLIKYILFKEFAIQ